MNLTPFPPSPRSFPSDLRFHLPTSSTPVSFRSKSSSESRSASSSGAVCSNSSVSVGMCCSGMEMLKVFENSREMCEGDERECVPSDNQQGRQQAMGSLHSFWPIFGAQRIE